MLPVDVQVDVDDLFTLLLDHFKLQLVPGYELSQLTRMIIAMGHGLALQARFPTSRDGADTHTDVFVEGLVLFIDGCTEPIPD